MNIGTVTTEARGRDRGTITLDGDRSTVPFDYFAPVQVGPPDDGSRWSAKVAYAFDLNVGDRIEIDEHRQLLFVPMISY